MELHKDKGRNPYDGMTRESDLLEIRGDAETTVRLSPQKFIVSSSGEAQPCRSRE
jgi:hypothetical protein